MVWLLFPVSLVVWIVLVVMGGRQGLERVIADG